MNSSNGPSAASKRKPSAVATTSRTVAAAGAVAASQCEPSVLTRICCRLRSARLLRPIADQGIVASTGGSTHVAPVRSACCLFAMQSV